MRLYEAGHEVLSRITGYEPGLCRAPSGYEAVRARCEVDGAGCRGCRVYGVGCRGCRVDGVECRV